MPIAGLYKTFDHWHQEGTARHGRTGIGLPLHGFYADAGRGVYDPAQRLHCPIS